MKLSIIKYPDKRLRAVSKEVVEFDNQLHTFLDSLYEAMLDSRGIGLAAIQVAKDIRLFIINIPDEDGRQDRADTLEFINPTILSSSGSCRFQEGCLSVPTFYEDIDRFESVVVRYSDRFGVEHTLEADDLLSIAIQHELDHLDGKLFIDKLSYSKRKKFEKEYKQLNKAKS